MSLRALTMLKKGMFDYKNRGEVEIKGGERLEIFELVGMKPQYLLEGSPNSDFLRIYEKVSCGELLLGFDV